jgi:hypothetical protein
MGINLSKAHVRSEETEDLREDNTSAISVQNRQRSYEATDNPAIKMSKAHKSTQSVATSDELPKVPFPGTDTPPKITTEIDYEAADAETSMPSPAEMAMEKLGNRSQLVRLGLAKPENVVDTTSRKYRYETSEETQALKEMTTSPLPPERSFSNLLYTNDAKFIRDYIIPEMPDKVNSKGEEDPEGSPSMLKKVFETPLIGPSMFTSLMNLAGSMEYGDAAFTDSLTDFFTAFEKNMPDTYDNINKVTIGSSAKPEQAAKKLKNELYNFIIASEAIPVLGTPAKLAREYRDVANQMSKRLKIDMAKTMSAKQKAEKDALAKRVAAEHRQISSDFIKEFEQKIGARSKLNIDEIIDESKIISVKKKGILTIDPEKARAVGKQNLEDINGAPVDILAAAKDAEDGKEVADFLEFAGDGISLNVLKPEKMDAFTAAASDIIAKQPDLYNPKKRLVDNLFEMSVNQELLPTGELLTILNKYDLSYEDYTTMVLGSASDAGRVLQKFAQISKRNKPKNEIRNQKEAALLDNQGAIMNFVRRTENIRRGLLVSQIATASRNLTSAGIRAPLEGLQNVMDTALYNMGQEGVIKGLKSFLSKANWDDSFRHMRYMMDLKNSGEVKAYTDYILDRPELSQQFDMMFNQINEVRRHTGAGTGGKLDKTLTAIEAGVDVLNTPNRWQEYLVRRGAFLGELERLAKNEYGIDLIDELNAGKLQDLLNDSPDIIGDKRSFKQLVADATEKALDITYAKQPDTRIFREATSFITRNGLTVVTPFPRFMFNSMELFGNYSFGALQPMSRKVLGVAMKDKRGPLTAKERKQVSRNLIGVGILGAAMHYRNDEEAPTDYKMLKTAEGKEMDTTPQSPILRQALWIAEAVIRIKDGSFERWADIKDAKETFLGVNVRVGAGDAIFNDVADMIATADATSAEAFGSTLGTVFGEYASTYLTPLNQLIDAQRGTGERGLEYRDVREEPVLQEDAPSTFLDAAVKSAKEPFNRRAYTTLFSPEDEEQYPLRETLFQKGGSSKRVLPLLKVFTGVGLTSESSETGKFLERLGFRDYKLRTRTISPGFQRYETKVLRELLPSAVSLVKDPAFISEQRKMYAASDKRKPAKTFIEDAQARAVVDILSGYKREIEDIMIGENEEGIVDPVSGNPIDIKLSSYLSTLQKFRRLKPSERRDALNKLPFLIKTAGLGPEKPNMAKETHLNMMLEYIKSTKLK